MKYVPDMNLLRAYSDVTDRLPAPTLAVFEFDNKKLIYCGTKHSADVSFQLIDKCFNDYDIDCVVTEVHHNAEPVKIQTHTRSRNELTYSARLGYERDIPVILADSSKYDWFTDLLKVDSNYLKPLQVFFMLDDAYTYKQHFKENYSIERALKNTIHKYWDDTLPSLMTQEEFQEYFLEQFGIEITDDNISDIYITHPEWHCPDNNGSLLNKMWSDIGMISRDPYMVKCIFDAVNSHDCVLATFGAGHLDKQIQILEQAFGKPTFVDIKA
jgi:hypothetical protein